MDKITSVTETIQVFCKKSRLRPTQCTPMYFEGDNPFDAAEFYRDTWSSKSPGENRFYGPFVCLEGVILIVVLNKP
jgi:hypothetical protein